jgi:hypothetical protein
MSLTMWPRNDGSSTPSIGLGGARAGLGELAGDAADLHRGHARRVGEHDRHLQDDLELVADGVGRERVEGLGAVAGLEQEGLAGGHAGELGEVAGLAGEHQRRQVDRCLEDPLERGLVGPVGLLRGGGPPGRRGPVRRRPAHPQGFAASTAPQRDRDAQAGRPVRASRGRSRSSGIRRRRSAALGAARARC